MNKYAKKICALLLAGTVLLTSCSNGATQGSTASSKPPETVQTDETNETTRPTGTTQPNKKPDYSELKCESPKNYSYINLIIGESTMAINMALPDEWKLYREGEKCYTVAKYGKEIGKLYFGNESELDEGKTEVYTDVKTNLGIETVYSVNRYGEEEYTYRRKIIFKYPDGEKTREVTLDINYTAIDNSGVSSLRGVPHTWEVVTEPKFNTVSFPENGNKNVLILGNSFVSTSRIGELVATLCADEGIGRVTAVSLPNVSIKDYAASEYYLSLIASGEYGVLFMCGLFSNNDVTGLEKIYDACQKGGTTLVLFPAHNEGLNVIERAQGKYPELVTVDWRNEIIKLIYSGVKKSSLCMDDGPEHSTPLAG